ncbi:protein SPT2 like [Crotalus adamanteus]|uniref:Protein SPT2 homolog n=1 Tax=Crotalus adamanteus TaxID=8729 RepID=A0AAW1C6K7_CROAD
MIKRNHRREEQKKRALNSPLPLPRGTFRSESLSKKLDHVTLQAHLKKKNPGRERAPACSLMAWARSESEEREREREKERRDGRRVEGRSSPPERLAGKEPRREPVMDFREILVRASEQQGSSAVPKRYSLAVGPPKKDPKVKGVQSAAVRAFLRRQEEEQKKKVLLEKRRKEELLARRVEMKHDRKARAMASRTKDNFHGYNGIPIDEKPKKKQAHENRTSGSTDCRAQDEMNEEDYDLSESEQEPEEYEEKPPKRSEKPKMNGMRPFPNHRPGIPPQGFPRPSLPPITSSYKRKFEDEDEYDSEMEDFIDDEGEPQEEISKHIREIFGYDRSKYKDESDYALRYMESTWKEQQKEEARSLRLGVQEDLEEQKREEEELKRKKQTKKLKTH